FPEFIEYAKKANPPLAYASGGNGSQHQLTMEMLKERAGFDMIHVPYKGGGPATAATMSGEVAALFSGTSSAPQIKAGRIRALAVAGAKRSPSFPELPNIRLPDGSSKSFPGPITVAEIAAAIGAGLARAALAGRVNGKLVDTGYRVTSDAEVAIVTDKDPQANDLLRHSTAHLLAHAVKELFPDAQV